MSYHTSWVIVERADHVVNRDGNKRGMRIGQFQTVLREELLGSGLVLGLPVLDGLLDLGDLVDDTGITRSQLLCLLQILQRSILLLQTLVGNSTAVVGLGLIGILSLGRIGDLKRICGPVLSLAELLELVAEQGRVGVQSESECLHLLAQLLGVIFLGLGELVQIAQTLLVLVETQVKITTLESSVAETLEVGSDLEAERCSKGLALVVLGEVFIWVACRILLALGRILVILAGKLAAVHDSHVLEGLVGLSLHVFDLANHTLAVDDLAEHDVLAIEVGSGDGGNEELTAVGAGPGVGHGEQEGTVMLEVEVLIGELFAVDRLAAGTVERSEVTTLNHELLDHTVEN